MLYTCNITIAIVVVHSITIAIHVVHSINLLCSSFTYGHSSLQPLLNANEVVNGLAGSTAMGKAQGRF